VITLHFLTKHANWRNAARMTILSSESHCHQPRIRWPVATDPGLADDRLKASMGATGKVGQTPGI